MMNEFSLRLLGTDRKHTISQGTRPQTFRDTALVLTQHPWDAHTLADVTDASLCVCV